MSEVIKEDNIARSEHEAELYELHFDFSPDALQRALKERGIAMMNFVGSRSYYKLLLSLKSHPEIAEEFGRDFDFGGRVNLKSNGGVDVRGLNSSFPHTTGDDLYLVGEVIRKNLGKLGFKS